MFKSARQAFGSKGVAVLDSAFPQCGDPGQGSHPPGTDPCPIYAGQGSILHVLQPLVHLVGHQGVIDHVTVIGDGPDHRLVDGH